MSVKCLLCCRVKRAMQDFEAKLTQELQALKTAISSKDDEMGRLVDGINTQIAGAREGVRAKKDSIRTNETQISRLQAEVNTRPDSLCASSHVPPGVSAPVSYHTVHYWIPYKLMSWLLKCCASQMSTGGQRAVSRAMLDEVKERERLAEAQVSARQTALDKAGLDKELQRLSSELTQLQGRSSALRQVSFAATALYIS